MHTQTHTNTHLNWLYNMFGVRECSCLCLYMCCAVVIPLCSKDNTFHFVCPEKKIKRSEYEMNLFSTVDTPHKNIENCNVYSQLCATKPCAIPSWIPKTKKIKKQQLLATYTLLFRYSNSSIFFSEFFVFALSNWVLIFDCRSVYLWYFWLTRERTRQNIRGNIVIILLCRSTSP